MGDALIGDDDEPCAPVTTVLQEHGLDVPDNLDVKVVENADDCVHLTLPAPPAGDMDLSDEDLSNAAGGSPMMTGGRLPCSSEWVRLRPRLPSALTAHSNGEDR